MWEFVNQCQEWLSKSASVRSYLVDLRHISPASLEAAKIGYYPHWANFEQLPGYPKELDRLRGRVVVPILSEFGKKVVGIAGRVPDPKVKGWWNTVFRKSSYLYGMDRARREMFAKNKVYLFEGYFDQIAMSQHGLPNSLAAMSTLLGIRRIGLIGRYCDEICLCFDTDANDAGTSGLLRTLADIHTLCVGVLPWKVTIVRLPKGEDPDDFVQNHGLDAFLALETPIEEKVLKEAEKAYEALKWRLNDRQRKQRR